MGQKSIESKATTSIILDSRRSLKDGSYPVKIRITFKRKQVYYSTPHNLTKPEFQAAMERQLSPDERKELINKGKKISDLKAKGLELRNYQSKAVSIIESMPFFTWEIFEKLFLTEKGSEDTISKSFDQKIKALRSAGQISTAVSYECAQKSINKYLPDAKFADVTPIRLNEYENYMLRQGNSLTTIGMYLRPLRAVFNIAISNKDIPSELYPFRRNINEKEKYEIPEGRNIKKALQLSAIEKVFNYRAEPGSSKEMARDYWVFIYLCNGMNVKDMCLLRYEDINNNILRFKRAKTIRQKKEKIIQAILQPEAKAIIKKWGNKKVDENTLIFPVLTEKETPERQYQLIQQITHLINDNMKEISEALKINLPLTTYTARHSFATVLKRSGASTELISEMLGHSNLKTTQNYLDSFENETLRIKTKALTAFKKSKKLNGQN